MIRYTRKDKAGLLGLVMASTRSEALTCYGPTMTPGDRIIRVRVVEVRGRVRAKRKPK